MICEKIDHLLGQDLNPHQEQKAADGDVRSFFAKKQYRCARANTGYTQKNGAVSKVNKKFISHLTRAQRTPSAVATVQVSHALITILQCVCTLGHTTHIHTVIKCIPDSV